MDLKIYVQRDSEVGVESEEGIRDSGEQLGESEGFCRECRKGPVGDDAVRVVAKDVFARRGENGGAMEAGREVGSEQRPDWQRAQEARAVGEGAGMPGAGKEDVDEVGNEDGPEEWDGAEEEEGAEEEGDAEGVPQDNECLQASLERDREGSEMDTAHSLS